MSVICPRCAADTPHVEYEGKESGRVVWTVYNCGTCRFTWRDTEPEAGIVYAKRDKFFRVDSNKLDRIAVHLPTPNR